MTELEKIEAQDIFSQFSYKTRETILYALEMTNDDKACEEALKVFSA